MNIVWYSPVLPPISTDGLTVNDVPELTTRVRDQMLDALRDISFNIELEKGYGQPRNSETSTNKGSELDPLSLTTSSTNEDEGTVSQVRTSSTASLASDSNHRDRRSEPSENGTETEEDEGMVLVGRPT